MKRKQIIQIDKSLLILEETGNPPPFDKQLVYRRDKMHVRVTRIDYDSRQKSERAYVVTYDRAKQVTFKPDA